MVNNEKQNRKKCLVMMPQFMGYETALISALKDKYETTFYNNEKEYNNTYKRYKNGVTMSFYKRFHLKKLKDKLLFFSQNVTHDEEMRGILREKWDIILTVEGGKISDSIYQMLKKKNPRAKMILFLWGDRENLKKNTHIQFFDKVYSYSVDDCSEYGYSYIPVFAQTDYVGHAEVNQYDIAVISTYSDERAEQTKKIYEKNKDKYRFFIFFYDPLGRGDFFSEREPLDYQQYIQILRQSKCILDLSRKIQKGPTTRFFDALMTDTKVITTNPNIQRYPVWSRNIEIIDVDDTVINEKFMQTEYVSEGKRALTANEWVSVVLETD